MEKRKPAARFLPSLWRLRLSSNPLAAPANEKNLIALPQLMVGCAQSVGMQRDHNEDAILTLTSLSANSDGYLPIGLFIIADGMGGHKHGEIASHLAVHTIAHRVMGNVMLPLLDSTPTSPGDPDPGNPGRQRPGSPPGDQQRSARQRHHPDRGADQRSTNVHRPCRR